MRAMGWIATGLVLLSGCADTDANALRASTSPNATAESPAAGSDTGSISGVVVGEEELPIPKAEVALLPAGAQTTTDDAGRFTFNEVAAGSHTLIVAALGFEDASKRVTLEAGQVAESRFQLKAIVLDAGPYVAIYPSTFYMTLDWGGYSSVLPTIEEAFCDPCNTWQNIAPAPSAVLIEMDWTKSVGLPYVADELGLLLSSNPIANSTTSTTGSGTRVANVVYSPREAYLLTETELEMLEKVKKTVSRVYTAQTSVAFQQKAYSWMATGYGGPLPEGFTMLPPK